MNLKNSPSRFHFASINFMLSLSLGLLLASGCASLGQKWRELVSGGTGAAPIDLPKEAAAPHSNDEPRYSEQQDLPVEENRHYRRMTREQFEKQALTDDTGSLWSADGQGSYLFSQNLVRVPGDSLNIAIDGEPKKQLAAKANILAGLLKQANRKTASAETPAAAATPSPAGTAAGAPAPAVAAATEKKEEKEDEGKEGFSVASVPARIIERVPDGSYRVRGTQTFMIGKSEYRVIATGLVKPADITEDGIPSSKMVDPKFDIVSMKKEIR